MDNKAFIWTKFIFFNFLGIFIFFIPITYNNFSSIPLDHIVVFIRNIFGNAAPYYVLLICIYGAILPFYNKSYKKNNMSKFFTICKVLSIFIVSSFIFKIGAEWMYTPGMLPFIINKLSIPVGIIIPIGAVFLSFLVSYGLLEFMGVFMQPVMRPLFKTPGRSAIDAVASFVGSYSVGLLVTNRVYKENKYTLKEASIIATGFSTVSTTFMIVIAKTLNLMEHWNKFFLITLVVTFLVTIITVIIYPLRNKPEKFFSGEGVPETIHKNNLLSHALKDGYEACGKSPNLFNNIVDNLKDGFKMATSVVPTIITIGFLGVVLAEYTKLFDILGYILYPVTLLLGIEEPLLVAKAITTGFAEMFLPALLVTKLSVTTKFIVAVTSVSQILFLSASIPCILGTDIDISLKEIFIIWLERVILTLVIVTPIAYFLFRS